MTTILTHLGALAVGAGLGFYFKTWLVARAKQAADAIGSAASKL